MTASDPTIDPASVLSALRMPGGYTTEPVTGGADTAIWRVSYSDASFALRLFRADQITTCDREVAAMTAAAAAGISVPHIHRRGTWNDRSVLLLSWAPGRPIAIELRSRPWTAFQLGTLFGRTHAAIHAVEPLADLRAGPSWITWAGGIDSDLRSRLEQVGTCTTLLHLDYHPANVLTDGRQITAVLDWANAHAGDPRADLARTATILRLDAGQIGKSLPRALLPKTVTRVFEAGWRRGYSDIRGQPADMAPFYAWAGSAMERDLSRRHAPAELNHVRRWTRHWEARL